MYKCGRCDVEMSEEYDIKLRYKEIDLPEAEGLRCPQCGIEFLLEDLVTEELNPAEDMLDGK